MEKRIKKCAVFVVLLGMSVLLCSCARKGPDVLDEILLPEGYDTGSQEMSDISEAVDAGEIQETEAAGNGDGEATDHVQQVTKECYVHICGAVQDAGVYRMEADDRIFAVVQKAGGFAPGACEDYVNLAKPVADGLRIWIPTTEEAEEERQAGQQAVMAEDRGLEYPQEDTAKTAPASSGAAGSPVNINTASVEQLMGLPGIGEAKARAILEYRSGHGDFSKKEDIMKVAGIKQSGYDKLKDQITVKQE